jgi:hypothetical protein
VAQDIDQPRIDTIRAGATIAAATTLGGAPLPGPRGAMVGTHTLGSSVPPTPVVDERRPNRTS